MENVRVVIIGGGATGVGILRDLSMRGVDALLLEQRDLAFGTSSRFHGLLHSGGRYAVKDSAAAHECAEENAILRKIGRHCVEATEGFFVRLPEDDPAYEEVWVNACQTAGIPVQAVSLAEACKLEPHLTDRAVAVYRVPDAAVDGFRLCRQNVLSAQKYGGRVLTYTEVVGIEHSNGRVEGVRIRNVISGMEDLIHCELIVNAAGSWVGKVASFADIPIHVTPDKGTLIAFNHRFTDRVVNRLRAPGNGDIFVPHGSVTILGTTSLAAERPDDFEPSMAEVQELLTIGCEMFEELPNFRILRAYTGTRPLYSADPTATGRAASRNFAILDHSRNGLAGFVSIVGGKLTTYRLMAEKLTDLVCDKLSVQAACRTAEEPIIEDPAAALIQTAKQYFPSCGVDLAASRLGPKFTETVELIRQNPAKKQLVCECELVTLAEVETVAADPAIHTVSDIRRRTRMGMGTCQGSYCGLRAVGMMVENELTQGMDTVDLLREFLEGRWNGIRPILWGQQVREAELTRGIYGAALNMDGVAPDETE
ncbi:MAG: anaerobic glycerol-3-phosphate dehydrogenase subunit A [Veillonellaceae bacterium]|nr:anaerobic glycerol-3-phosphate dehydrogenase subunit A [Veillonellaceae bacterium]